MHSVQSDEASIGIQRLALHYQKNRQINRGSGAAVASQAPTNDRVSYLYDGSDAPRYRYAGRLEYSTGFGCSDCTLISVVLATHVGLTDPASLCSNASSNGSIRRKGRHPADAAVMHARANALSEAIGSIDASCHAAAGKPTVGIGLSSAEPKKAPNLAENLETGTTAWLRSPFTCVRGRGYRAR